MVTLASLVASLGRDLVPIVPAMPLPVPVVGVHISELPDPTPFLTGGELLLSTGMPLVDDHRQVDRYVAVLTEHAVAALGIGLGPVHHSLPPHLREVCSGRGLPLLQVPPKTPFQRVTREFWTQVGQADQRVLGEALGAHRSLVRATAGPEPVAAVIRVLASAVHGWAAQLSPAGQVGFCWPASRAREAEEAADQVRRLRMAAPNSSATFPLGADDVVVHPLHRAGRVRGYLAVARQRPFQTAQRHLAQSASALLELRAEQEPSGLAREREAGACLVRLLLGNLPEAARRLATDLGRALPSTVHVVCGLGVCGTDLEDVPGWSAVPYADTPDGLVALVTPDHADELWQDLLTAVRTAGGTFRVSMSAPVALSDVGQAALALRRRLISAPPQSSVRGGAPTADSRTEDQLARLRSYRRADLIAAVTAYLRHQGRALPAAS